MNNGAAVNKWLNLLVIVLLFLITLFTAYEEHYLACGENLGAVIRWIFWPVLGGGFLLALWVALSISSR